MLSLASKQALVTMALFVTIWQQPTIGNANNNYFLPGDSFFHTVLTEVVLVEMEKSKSLILRVNLSLKEEVIDQKNFLLKSIIKKDDNLKIF